MTARAAARLDHLVVTAPSLAAGVEWIEAILGVPMQAGGAHARMGTHNALLRLGGSTYLEVLAIDPAAAAPGRPRWFDLDSVPPGASPRLAAWVVRTEDIRRSVAECPSAYGAVEAMSRGRHEWLITVPPDGSLLAGGTLPFLIEWTTKPHPAEGLTDQGCELVRLELHSPDQGALALSLECLGLAQDESIDVHRAATAHLVAHIATPSGTKLIGAANSVPG